MKRVSNCILFAVAFMLSLSGCAATHTAVQITKANQAVKRAKDRGATEYAIYEYTMAEHYLTKAREEAGASDFKDSVTLAHGAAEWADRAIIIIEKEGRGLDETTLPGETQMLTEEDRARPDASSTPIPDEDSEQREVKDDEAEEPMGSSEAETGLDTPETIAPLNTPDTDISVAPNDTSDDNDSEAIIPPATSPPMEEKTPVEEKTPQPVKDAE